MDTFYPAKKTVTHLGVSFAPGNVLGTQKSKENASRGNQRS